MLKIFIWVVSNDGRFLNTATNILNRQHNGIEIIGSTANEKVGIEVNGKIIPYVPLEKLTGGGYMILMFCSSSAQGKSA